MELCGHPTQHDGLRVVGHGFHQVLRQPGLPGLGDLYWTRGTVYLAMVNTLGDVIELWVVDTDFGPGVRPAGAEKWGGNNWMRTDSFLREAAI